MPTQLEELVEFLHSPQASIREIALENVVQYSPAGPNSQQTLFKYDDLRPVKDLKVLTRDNSEKKGKIVKDSLTILSNLCGDIEFRQLIVKDESFLKHIITELTDLKTNTNADLMCILLTNLAKSDDVVTIFNIQIEPKDKTIFKSNKAMDILMDIFVKGNDRKLNKFANFDYLSYFFADISRFSKGRDYFVTEQEYDNIVPISKLLVFTEKYDAKTRREGVCSTIKNSLFDTDKHMKLLTDEKINLLPFIIGPFAFANNKGLKDDEIFELPDELQLLGDDKQVEPLKELIAIHIESLLLLCVSKDGREYLRGKSVYPLIRELHKNCDDDETIMELCDRLVNMLMRDEPAEATFEEVEPMDEDGSDSDSDSDDKIMEVL